MGRQSFAGRLETSIVVTVAPLVSIVTPCYNSARFLDETINSVLRQDYQHIEYIVMDGGSTDETPLILKKYEGRIRIYSEPDSGTADAINRGFQKSHGSIFAYLNADDTYVEGAVSTAVCSLLSQPSAAVVYGDAMWVDENGHSLGLYPAQPYNPSLLERECFICQPAAFIRQEAFRCAGMMNSKLHFGFDYDLWIRMSRAFEIRKIDSTLATSRMHGGNKTLSRRRAGLAETLHILKAHYGYVPFGPVHAYASHLIDGRDQFFDPSPPTLPKYLLSLPIGLVHNFRQPWRYVKEWGSVMSIRALARRITGRCC